MRHVAVAQVFPRFVPGYGIICLLKVDEGSVQT